MNPPASRRGEFERAFPGGFFVDSDDRAELERYLRARGWIQADETLDSVEKAGEGNMNLTLRIRAGSRSFILKQARPWVEKYPSIEAPPGRALVESAFYETAGSRPPLRRAMPKLLGRDGGSGVLVLEDLGYSREFTRLYRGERLSREEGEALIAYLVALHDPFPSLDALFQNRHMRALNHEHMFRLPLAPNNGLDLDASTPGLGELARSLAADGAYVGRVRGLGELYLEDGPHLVHGDYFPGSWLDTPSGLRIIDPEFCFAGAAAFDLGVLAGHLHLSRQPEGLADELVRRYRRGTGVDDAFVALALGFAGVEIMRRILGVAQLPLQADLDEKASLLELSRRLALLP